MPVVKDTVILIKKHPIALSLYFIYTAISMRETSFAWEFYSYRKLHPGDRAPGGELLLWADTGMFLMAGLFFIVCGCLAAAYKSEARFYLWMALIAIIQPIVFLNIGAINER
jgi:hypothetical protein